MEKQLAEVEARLTARIDKQEREVTERLVKLETKMEVFWGAIEENVPKMLHSPHTPLIDGLLDKVRDRTITRDEAVTLKELLEKDFNSNPQQEHALGYVLLIARLKEIIGE